MPYKNIEDRRASVMRAYHRLRQRLIDLKGGECSECGACYTEVFQEIHHTAEDGKNKKRSKSRYKEYRRLLDHPEDYELLCRHPCHKRVTMRYVASFRQGGSRRAVE